jgi:hypothetical protein
LLRWMSSELRKAGVLLFDNTVYRSGSDERAARSGHGVHDPLLYVRLCSRRHYKVYRILALYKYVRVLDAFRVKMCPKIYQFHC